MNKLIAILIIVVLFLSFKKESGKIMHKYEDSHLKCYYETCQGRFDGSYASYYKNGHVKSEGKFENNYRIGKWTVWDSTGRIRMQRIYSDPFNFKRTIPKAPNDKSISLLNTSQYMINYNKDGVIDYFKLEERAVVWAKRIWRTILPKDNATLFENNAFFNILNKNVFNKNIDPYSVSDDEFRNELELNKIDTSKLTVIAYKIKEDTFFDSDRMVSESRIIGICPIVVNKLKNDTISLYWLYFPEIRKYFGQEKIKNVAFPSKIKTFDDLFFYRCFYGQIEKESNVYDKPIASYKKGVDINKEAERIELSLIEEEHDIWISFTK